MKTLLITGGAGFIGGAFIRQALASTTDRLVNVDALTYAGCRESVSQSDSVKSRHFFVHGDIRDEPLIERLLETYDCSAVVNFAAETHVDQSIDRPLEFADTNVMGAVRLLHASHKYWTRLDKHKKREFRFLHVSTDEVYGSLGDTGKFTEQTAYAPNSPYSASKAASDHLVRAYHRTYGLPTLITHCSNNYGPFQYPEKLIPLMILRAAEWKRLPIYGNGKNIRDWIYVDDHCEAIRTVLELASPGETYNIGGNCEMSNVEVVQLICDAMDRLMNSSYVGKRRELIEYVADRPGHDFRYAIDCSKIKDELGWTPKTPFEQGIEQTIRWYLDGGNQAFWQRGDSSSIPQ